MPTLRTRAGKGSALTHAELDANFTRPVDQKTTTYACLVGDNRSLIEGNHATTPFTITLGDATTMDNAEPGDYEISFSNINAAAVTIARAGADTIDSGSTSIVLQKDESITLKTNNAGDGYQTVGKKVFGILLVDDATDSTSGTTGAINTAGGLGVTKDIFCGGDILGGAGELQAETATTSGTTHDYTGIPSWARKIHILLNGVSTNGVSPLAIQLGDAGGIETSGYQSTVSHALVQEDSTTRFLITAAELSV